MTVLHMGRVEKSLSQKQLLMLVVYGKVWRHFVPSVYLAASPVKNPAQTGAGAEAGKPSERRKDVFSLPSSLLVLEKPMLDSDF